MSRTIDPKVQVTSLGLLFRTLTKLDLAEYEPMIRSGGWSHSKIYNVVQYGVIDDK